MLSRGNQKQVFNCLMPHFNKESLIKCFHKLDGKKAVGIDRKTKKDYGKNLNSNIENLIQRMKAMSYYPQPVREVLIPKGDGKTRPLGISTFEDKMVQMRMCEILEAIYDPIFHDFSYGFRRNRGCHDALKALHKHLYKNNVEVVFDADLQNFFGTISHGKLMALLEMKVKDKRLLEYIVRMLKAGVLKNGDLTKTTEGTPQGSIVSPVLANIFAHYAYDDWFHREVKPRTSPTTKMVRYADDLVICGKREEIERITKSFKGRTERFSLKLNEEKSKTVSFDKRQFRETRQGTFDFLGFTFYLGLSRSGKIVLPKLMTSRKRKWSKLKVVNEWCKKNRNRGKLAELWKRFCIKLRGHIQYYGVSFNMKGLNAFSIKAIKIFFMWMNRRSQKKSFDWNKFKRFRKTRAPPKCQIHHQFFTALA